MTTHASNKHHHSSYDLYDDVEKIKEAVFEAAQNAKGKAGEVISDSIDDVRKQTTTLKKNVSNYTAEKPLKSLGIAMLAGLMIGYFLHK